MVAGRRNIGIGHIDDTEIAREDGSHDLHSDDHTLDRYLFTRESLEWKLRGKFQNGLKFQHFMWKFLFCR